MNICMNKHLTDDQKLINRHEEALYTEEFNQSQYNHHDGNNLLHTIIIIQQILQINHIRSHQAHRSTEGQRNVVNQTLCSFQPGTIKTVPACVCVYVCVCVCVIRRPHDRWVIGTTPHSSNLSATLIPQTQTSTQTPTQSEKEPHCSPYFHRAWNKNPSRQTRSCSS